ncbi:Lpp/OprI family alanine-zipper lipoprotein [Acidithiobacillus sp. YTS05]|nr:Lpp/OprI family alanine-zipper lipoprotein [Acidithiobacillus sp. YTS05]
MKMRAVIARMPVFLLDFFARYSTRNEETVMSKLTTTLKVAALILPLGLAGCATNSDLAKVASKADAAQSTANEALAKANAAQNTANDALSKANAAQSTADQAMSTANAANQKAEEANEKVERMFKKAMMK